MNDEIKELLNTALPPSPPTAMDSDTAVADGRRRLGRRRYAAGGGALAGVAAVAVAISLAMNTVGGNGGIPGANAGASPSASASASEDPEIPGGVRPELDPNGKYFWYRNMEGPQTDETSVLTERLWVWLAETYDVQTPGVKAEFLEETAVLTEHIKDGKGGSDLDETRPVGFGVPLLTLQTPGYGDRNGIAIPAAEGVIDNLNVQVWPAGSFSRPEVPDHDGPPDREVPSPGGPRFFELAHCSDYVLAVQAGQTLTVRPDCDVAMGDSGLKVTNRTAGSTGHEWTEMRAIYYAEDGSAIVLTDVAENAGGDIAEEPTFDGDALLDLALALVGADGQGE